MTEEEAKNKWCPMYRNIGSGSDYAASCIASACMMWRSAGCRNRLDNGGMESEPIGYCGLGGKP